MARAAWGSRHRCRACPAAVQPGHPSPRHPQQATPSFPAATQTAPQATPSRPSPPARPDVGLAQPGQRLLQHRVAAQAGERGRGRGGQAGPGEPGGEGAGVGQLKHKGGGRGGAVRLQDAHSPCTDRREISGTAPWQPRCDWHTHACFSVGRLPTQGGNASHESSSETRARGAPGRGVPVLEAAVVDGDNFVARPHQLGGHGPQQRVANHLGPRACQGGQRGRVGGAEGRAGRRGWACRRRRAEVSSTRTAQRPPAATAQRAPSNPAHPRCRPAAPAPAAPA